MAITKWTDERITDHFLLSEYTVNQSEKANCPLTRKALLHAQMLEELRVWYAKPMTVNAWYRTSAYNKSVGGNANSNHLKGCATDFGMKITTNEFCRIARKWKEICEKHGTVGEAGYYLSGWIHLGSSITYSKTFYNWYTDRNKKQTNMYFKI